MIGAETAVLLDPPPEFSEHQDGDIVCAADALEVFHESAHRVGRVHQQPAVDVRLRDVRVERVALMVT